MESLYIINKMWIQINDHTPTTYEPLSGHNHDNSVDKGNLKSELMNICQCHQRENSHPSS